MAEFLQVGQEGFGIGLNAALPNDEYSPAQGLQLGAVGGVPGKVAVQLLVPILLVGSRAALTFAAMMSVPEATLHQHSSLITLEYQVGCAG